MNKTYSSFSKIYLFLFIFSMGILFNFIIPPFQNPDEPQHFGGSLVFRSGESKERLIEKQTIALMNKNNWFKFVGLNKRKDLPDNFTKMDFVKFKDFASSYNNIFLYQYLLGKIQKILPKMDILSSYYFCRMLSLFLIIGSFFLLHSSFKKLTALYDSSFSFCIFFLLFLPQLLIISISVNPDVFSIFISSLFFYAVISLLLINKYKAVYLFLIIFSVITGFFVDKPCFFLLPMAIILPVVLLKKKKVLNNLLLLGIFISGLIMTLAWIVWYFPSQFYFSMKMIEINIFAKIPTIIQFFSFNKLIYQFFLSLADSFFFKFGWMAFGAEKVFYYIWRSIILFSVSGILAYFGKVLYCYTKKYRSKLKSYLPVKLILFLLFAVSIQIMGVWIYQGSRNFLPQGRYLFPLIIPIAILFILGLKTFFDLFHKKGGKVAISTIITLMFFFLNYCIWNYMIPVFHMSLTSPHAGM